MSTIINEPQEAAVENEVLPEGEALDAALKGEAQPEADGGQEDDKPKFVPHAALHEEREKRKALEREAAELRAWQRQVTERMNAAEARRAEQEALQNAPKAPSLDEDPIGAIVHKLETIEERGERERQERINQAQQAQWESYVHQDRQQFVAQNPDFEAAINHLASNRQAMYEAMGFGPQEVQQALVQDAQNIALVARQRGQSPSQILYNLAKSVGYQRSEDQSNKLATIQRGQETTRTAGAGKAKASLTPQDLLNMSPEDFDKNWDKVMRG